MKPPPFITSSSPQLIDFAAVGTSQTGHLTVAQQHLVPFAVQTIYWVYGATQTTQRGNHAHKNAEQVIFALQGQVRFDLENINGQAFHFVLDTPHVGLYIPKMYWRTYELTPHDIVLCLASMPYLEEDYIRDYQLFTKK